MDQPAPPAPPPPAPAKDPATLRREALLERLGRAEQAAKARHFGEATGICQDILAENPDLPAALAVMGAVLGHRGELAQATVLLERAVAADATVAAWHGNLSGLYRMQHRLDEALASGLEAVRLKPDQAGNHLNLGKVHLDRGEREAALGEFLETLARDPENPEAHLAIGQILLAAGDLRPGWIEYEWRNKLEQAKGMVPKMVAPLWNGMHLPGRRILLVGDQGYGDTLQFSRFIPMVAERCGEVLVGSSPDLGMLLRGIPGVSQVLSRWSDIPRHSAYALMSSLPGILGTEVASIPATIPYLTPDPAAVQSWAARLEQLAGSARLRVGLVWAGRPTHPNDSRRSMRLETLAPLAAIETIRLVSLQKPIPARDAAAFAAMPGAVDVAEHLTDFGQTAAALVNLDLLVTVDSAVAHLAGALGKPVWLMLPRPSDWRWMLDRTDSPWYPTVRLFRQPRPGDWAPVVAEVARTLSRLRRRS
ncbi:MAG: glycosyltransferase family protein [Acidisphaera sp.]|nr:glycosyltransferase family protein [Acidisphaera sp.]